MFGKRRGDHDTQSIDRKITYAWKEYSQKTQLRDHFFITSHWIQMTKKDLRHWTKAYYKGQSMRIHPLHFEPEAVDNKQPPSDLIVEKEKLDKIQIETMTKNLIRRLITQGTTKHYR